MLDVLTNILQTTVLYATPLILAAIGGLFSERSGVVNIGLEGLMTIGAFTGAVTTLVTHNPWIGLLAAIVAGILFALPHAVASITFKADQVVSGVAINFLALGVSVYLVKSMYNGAAQTPTVQETLTRLPIPGLDQIPVIGPALFNAFPTTYLAILVVIVTYFLLYRTPFGMRLRAVGEHPRAAETMGVNVFRMRYVAVLISGALAGAGGAGLSIAIGSEFNQTTVAGQGFISLAALIFGKWNPFGVLGAATFFGFAVGLALIGQIFGLTTYIPSEVLNMLPYILTILALAGFVGRAEGPAAVGKPYETGGR
ncbi:ABC transporter permease [Kroppenstedtia eburnea]|uniref:Nucleoside ABC transporter membrane protein n=1 Tax=Kroppenstedtia eburnea TaxID=714067 RepID=A0A1N7IUM1_9BACL|nr:ABC transporter permease [Kroppenstedtia eburnea]EGK13732.1 ABC superfamily ATP binding cassette transporter, membrane protein [Desmospora sp. 8437]QKI82214.1 ABC transporter permease [Kroppenstedtia eburnea]SIS40764.1 nucleoside ABC transporter membrane protein [Kroppenstedtia eburnea]